MIKLLIVDRDQTERQGIKWFVQSYHLPFSMIYEAGSTEEATYVIQNYQPEVICLELEMIQDEAFANFAYLIKSHVQKVICLTTEPVFERALQAIEINAVALLVKPVSPEYLKQVLNQATRLSFSPATNLEPLESKNDYLGYSSLFSDQPFEGGIPSFLLFQPEHRSSNRKLYEWLKEYYLPYPFRCYALSDMVVCLMELPQESEYQILQTEGQRLIQRWQEEQQNRIIIAVYPSSVAAPSLHQMYLRTKDALKMQFFKGYQQLYWVDEVPSFIEIDPFLTPEEQRGWVERLESGDKEAIKTWVYQVFTQFTDRYPNPDLLRIKLTSILAQLRRFIRTYQLDQHVEMEHRYHQVFQTILYTPILFRIVQDVLLFCYKLMDKVEEQKSSQAYDTVERGLQFIEQHYARATLSLEDVARFVELSPSYFSALLSKKKEKTFRQILNERRIQEVKKELLGGNKTIQQITDQVGFNDPNYLTRVFKAYVGVSPRQFRQNKGITDVR